MRQDGDVVRGLRQELAAHLAGDVSEAKITTLVAIGETEMVQT